MVAKLTFVEQTWERQPVRGANASAAWKSKGLVALFDTTNAIEVISGDYATNRSSLTSSTKHGLAADFSGSANQQYAHRPAYAVLGDITIIVLLEVRSLSNYGALIAKQSSPTTYCPYEFRIGNNSNDGNTSFLRASAGSYENSISNVALVSAGFSGVLALTQRLSGIPTVYLNNIAKPHYSAITITPQDNGSPVWIGSRQGGATQLDGKILYVALFNKVLIPEQIREITANPWQIFEPEQIPLFYSAGGGGATNLSIFDALHSHAGDNLTFSLDTYLAAQDSTHAHSADNLTLDATTSISLVLSESLHGLSSDVIAFITGSYLQVADALHGHSADALTLATASFLAVADALHAHTADNLTLDTSNATPLTTQDATHAHSADNNALTLDTWLAIVEAVHAQSADNVSISSEELLVVADALHSYASDALALTLPSPPGTCPTAAEIAAAILAAAQITPIYSDIRKVNNLSVNGSGTDGDPWGPV